MVERQATDLEVRVRIPVQVEVFLLKFNLVNGQTRKLQGLSSLIILFKHLMMSNSCWIIILNPPIFHIISPI